MNYYFLNAKELLKSMLNSRDKPYKLYLLQFIDYEK